MIFLYDDICKEVQRLKEKYGTSDPMKICNELGIVVMQHHLGTTENSIKGFYQVMNRIKMIIINADLSPALQRIILSHELGHAQLHKSNALMSFSDVNLCHQKAQTEKEANFFAAELLIEDEDLLEQFTNGQSIFEAASILGVPVEIVDYKFKLLHQKGYNINFQTNGIRSDFLKRVPVMDNDVDHIC